MPNIGNGLSALTLASCILFGGFMGLWDDWMDLKWRYKAFLPIIAALPLIAIAKQFVAHTSLALPFLGTINFGLYYYLIIIPILVTIVTNSVNQLGGLNGLETVPPAIVMIGLMTISHSAILLVCPLMVWLVLAFFNFRGKIFVGNTGSFAIGITLPAFAIISDYKFDLAISILPYIFNSAIILLTFFFYKTKGSLVFDGEKLVSYHRRSLVTLITYKRPLTERQVVIIISLLFVATTSLAVLARLLFNL